MNPRGRVVPPLTTPQAPNQIVRRSWTYDKGMLFFSYEKDPLDFAVLMNRAQNFRDPILAMGTDIGDAHRPGHQNGWEAQEWETPTGKHKIKLAGLTTVLGGEHFYFPSITFLNNI